MAIHMQKETPHTRICHAVYYFDSILAVAKLIMFKGMEAAAICNGDSHLIYED